MNALLTRFQSYPLAMRLVLIVLLIAAAGLMWHDFVWASAKRWHQEVDDGVALVQQTSARRTTLERSLQEAIIAIGPVEMPGGEQDANDELTAAVADILTKHNLRGHRLQPKSRIRMPRGTLATILPPNAQVERIVNDLKFDCTPQVLIKVLADLEASPKIEAISSVRLTKSTDPRQPGMVSVNLSVEAWVVTSGRAVPGGRT